MDNRPAVTSIESKEKPTLSLPDVIAGYGDRLLRSACLMCGRSGIAQDIVQETFCRALASLQDFRGEAGIYTWLFSIMRNVYLKQLRHEKRFLNFLLLQPRLLHDESNPAVHCERNGAHSHLMEAMQKLPAKQREVVILRFVGSR